MAEDDIYGNKRKYEKFISNLESINELPKEKNRSGNNRKYYSKNKENIKYFKKLHKVFESRDTSYIKRVRLFGTLLVCSYITTKDFSKCDREDINEILAFNHTINKSIRSKRDFIKDLEFMWKILFPEKDEKGREDETLIPYVVRHLSTRIDISKEKKKNDRLTWEQYERLLEYFNGDPTTQFFIALIQEALSRPQETLYTKISNLEMNGQYAKIHVSEHGKEGTKFLQVIDSYPYLLKMSCNKTLTKLKYILFCNILL